MSKTFKLALVAGHYLGTPGKRCPKELDPNQTREWWLNNRIVSKIEKNLADYNGIEILRIDDPTGKTDVPLKDRVAKGNDWNADFWLSIHANAAKERTFNGGGIAAYVAPNASEESKKWQKALYKASVKETGLVGDRATPIATASHYETRYTKMPAVLMECGFMNSTVDCPIILTEKFADRMAKACTDTIVEMAGLKKKAAKKATTTKPAVKTTVTLPILTKGVKCDSVKTLQMMLNARGFTDAQEKPLAVDGSFGPSTLYALKTFQDSIKGLEVDGKCGPATWKALLNAL